MIIVHHLYRQQAKRRRVARPTTSCPHRRSRWSPMASALCPLRNLNGGTLEPPKPLLSTPMDRTELWIVFAPTPGPVGI